VPRFLDPLIFWDIFSVALYYLYLSKRNVTHVGVIKGLSISIKTLSYNDILYVDSNCVFQN